MRYLLLDRITSLDPPQSATGVKCVSLAEDFFADHFPGLPVMPGSLILESMAQLAGTLLEASKRQAGQDDLYAVLAMVDKAKFRRPVLPGDRLELEATSLSERDDGGRVRTRATVDARIVGQAELTFALMPLTNVKVIAQRKELLRVWLRASNS